MENLNTFDEFLMASADLAIKHVVAQAKEVLASVPVYVCKAGVIRRTQTQPSTETLDHTTPLGLTQHNNNPVNQTQVGGKQ